MTDSLITRCPKCSTAFRVTDDVLSMAKGKVRCGQCFHIFDAREAANKITTPPAQPTAVKEQILESKVEPELKKHTPFSESEPETNEISKGNTLLFTSADDEPVSPEWLQTLFDEDDLAPGTPDDPLFDAPKHTHQPSPTSDDYDPTDALLINTSSTSSRTKQNNEFSSHTNEKAFSKPQRKENQAQKSNDAQTDPAPWELELAEVEAALNATPRQQPIKKETLELFTAKNKHEELHATPEAEPEAEPDYMVALHSLAQETSKQDASNRITSQHAALDQLTGQEYLDPLLGEYEKEQKSNKKPRTFLWFLGVLFGLFALATQVTGHFFLQGSQSENFRVLYRTFCTYTGCTLPVFVDINAISIQHVRIQSHPTKPNALLVNAIMTNTSKYAQPMPKIALEFFDLNGAPVAARLFSPRDYLDKDFLDITYMPPNTPIHLVIPIRDPGARAVTHQLRVFPAGTRSY
ncbi:DUF3426 domain-containing protein [Marinomonas flavescens]|uniref:DUF3426 domain-containing protein n=1 Tax=Marinomonas flavescens TaxID=2529379 RepID=UPI001054AE8D|nr:DUF3426 domain-containing protein [Marinomonas flavescens]